MSSTNSKTIVINCLDVIGETMAGPAIRSWEFANQLSKNHSVTILSPNKPLIKSTSFKLRQCTKTSLKEEISKADFIITQIIQPEILKLAKKYQTKIIVDAYDPITIETLESMSGENIQNRIEMNKLLVLQQSLSFRYADSVICASEKQRDLWIGVLSSMNKITPTIYDKDNSLRSLIDVVPFGLSSQKPVRTKEQGLREKFGLSKNDFVILWGGGIWNWFDPLSLIEAIAKLKSKKITVKLVFMGIDHPNPKIPRMPMVDKAFKLAAKLNLKDELVFFNEGWVPYKSRQQFLLDADVGVSTHYDHLETRFSFRTRILDYMWAGLPIIATQGDSFAELIEEQGLGEIVMYKDVDSIVEAIEKLSTNKEHYQQVKTNLEIAKNNFYWEKCVEPIENMINFWSENKPEKNLKSNIFLICMSKVYGVQGKITRKKIGSLIGIRSNYHRIGRVYRSQDIIRRKSIKKALGIDKNNKK